MRRCRGSADNSSTTVFEAPASAVKRAKVANCNGENFFCRCAKNTRRRGFRLGHRERISPRSDSLSADDAPITHPRTRRRRLFITRTLPCGQRCDDWRMKPQATPRRLSTAVQGSSPLFIPALPTSLERQQNPGKCRSGIGAGEDAGNDIGIFRSLRQDSGSPTLALTGLISSLTADKGADRSRRGTVFALSLCGRRRGLHGLNGGIVHANARLSRLPLRVRPIARWGRPCRNGHQHFALGDEGQTLSTEGRPRSRSRELRDKPQSALASGQSTGDERSAVARRQR